MRIIALSATLPNLGDIGEFLGCETDAIHYFDESYRPVPLDVHTLSMGIVTNPFLFDKSLDERVNQQIARYSEDKPVLVFCPSKKGTEILAKLLSQRLIAPHSILRKARSNLTLISGTRDTALRALLSCGLAYHHSGLPPEDRSLVEQLYLEGCIYVLCSTTTLAHGVNLPAHLVIVKGTSCWRGGSRGYERITKADTIQMLGRAGRPGFDERGVAVIMTSQQDYDFYAGIALNAEVIESKLQRNLIEGKLNLAAQTTAPHVNRTAYFQLYVQKLRSL
jgi:ATP-dependent DNA helicase HFM1/MER3